MRWVKAWDANNWYAIGYAGTFLKTSDAGNTWFLNKGVGGMSSTDFAYNLFDGYFFDMNTGLACGESGALVRTTDGGLTWNQVFAGPSSFIYDLFFLDQNVGFACGLTAVGVIKTTDGGLTWSSLPTTPPDNGYSIYAHNENVIFLGSQNGNVLRTTDGGNTWTTTFAAGSSLIWEVEFIDSLTGMVSGIDAAVAVTTDGGVTWNVANTGLPSTSDFLGLKYVNNAFYLTGDPYMIYSSTDLGTTWVGIDYLSSTQPWTTNFYSTDFIDDDHFISGGGNGMFNEVNTATSTVTAHTTWIKAGTFYDIWVESSSGRVIVVGGPGISGVTYDHAVYSADGGETWNNALLIDSTEHDFNALSMVSSTTGYAAGEDHIVYKTTDGGETWFAVTQPAVSSTDLETIFFLDENTGYTFGGSGLGYKTTDGGSSWTPLTTGVTANLWGSYFLNSQTGYVVGSSGTVLKTTDGGASFTPQNPGFTTTVYSIYMVNDNVGYLCGSSGNVKKTVNGGLDWTDVSVGNTGTTNYKIKFRNESNGIVVGSTGRTYITSDGGNTWFFENTVASTLYSVAIEENINGVAAVYTCGSLGYIQRNLNAVIPVELSAFTAVVNDNSVTLNWQTSTEQNNHGFYVERKSEKGNWQEIKFIEGSGTTTELRTYSFTDNNLTAGIYYYRLRQVDFDGSFQYHNLSHAVEIGAPEVFSLEQNYPNPFNPVTTIKYNLPKDEFVSLTIYNLLGEKVMDVVNTFQKAGIYNITVDASNLSSGTYIYKMRAGDYHSVKKMILLK